MVCSIKDNPESHQPEKQEEKNQDYSFMKAKGNRLREETVSMLSVCKMVAKNMSIRFEDMKII